MNIKRKRILINIIITAFILAGMLWLASLFVHFGGEFTNNAQIRQDIIPVLSRVQGFIDGIYFDEFKPVKKGDTLAIIEDTEFRLRLAQAEADCQEIEIRLSNAEAEYLRYKNLLQKQAVTKQQFDAVETQYKSLKAKLDDDASKQGVCKAALDLAKLNLSYTKITAPANGYTSRKTVHKGELVMPGKQIVSIVDNDKKWIIVNYRETQLKNIHIGDKVSIKVDAYPNVEFEGRVEAISNATGAQFAIAANDNSVGNFVKVEQRVPIKIVFTENNDKQAMEKLASGMNAECTVKRRD